MGWIKLETHIFDKVEVYAMAEILQIDSDSVVGKLCRIWSWFDLNTVDGVTPSVTKSLLDRYCGNAGFCNAMISVKWMEESDENIYLPNYDRHNSQTAKDRALGAKRAARHKKNKDLQELKSNAITNAEPLAKSKIDKIRKEYIYTEDFENFFKAYGKPVGKKKAFDEWKKVKPDSDLILLMIAKATSQAKSTESKFRKDPERWIKDRRWEDEANGVIANQPEYKHSENGWHRLIKSTQSWISVREDQVPQQFKESA